MASNWWSKSYVVRWLNGIMTLAGSRFIPLYSFYCLLICNGKGAFNSVYTTFLLTFVSIPLFCRITNICNLYLNIECGLIEYVTTINISYALTEFSFHFFKLFLLSKLCCRIYKVLLVLTLFYNIFEFAFYIGFNGSVLRRIRMFFFIGI